MIRVNICLFCLYRNLPINLSYKQQHDIFPVAYIFYTIHYVRNKYCNMCSSGNNGISSILNFYYHGTSVSRYNYIQVMSKPSKNKKTEILFIQWWRSFTTNQKYISLHVNLDTKNHIVIFWQFQIGCYKDNIVTVNKRVIQRHKQFRIKYLFH